MLFHQIIPAYIAQRGSSVLTPAPYGLCILYVRWIFVSAPLLVSNHYQPAAQHPLEQVGVSGNDDCVTCSFLQSLEAPIH